MTDFIPQIVKSLDQLDSNVVGIAPEITLFLGVLILVVLDFFPKIGKTVSMTVMVLLLAICTVLTVGGWDNSTTFLFDGAISKTPLASLFKLAFYFAALLTTVLFRDNFSEKVNVKLIMLLAILLGANMMVMASHYLTMFIAIEMVSISAYILVSMHGTKKSYEAGLKYLLFGALSTSFFLYGVSWFYGFTGTLEVLNITDINFETKLVFVASLLVLFGILFKIGVVPMHIWLPDVYQGSPSGIVAFLAFVPKVAGLGLLINWLKMSDLWLSAPVQNILALVVVLSLILGSFSAIQQHNVKRLMGYSSILQSGFLLLGILSFSSLGIQALVFYSLVFLVMNYLVFFVIYLLERNSLEELKDFGGFIKVQPFMVIGLIVGVVSLIGLPPTAGFTGKLLLLSSIWSGNVPTMVFMAFWIAILATLVSVYFYLRVIHPMIYGTYIANQNFKVSNFDNSIIIIFSIILLLLFIKSDILMNFIVRHLATL